MIPLHDENPAEIPPVVTRGLIALNVAVFLYELGLGPAVRGFFFQWGVVPARFTLALDGQADPIGAGATLLTSMFLHSGWIHLLGNMWYLWIFGDNVEDRLGHGRFLGFYVLGGVAAALMHFALNPGSQLPTVGASGAIAAVLGAYAVTYPGARVVTLLPLIVIYPIVTLPALLVLGLWFVMQFFSGALSIAWAHTADTGGTAWWAHVGGFAFGAIAVKILGMRSKHPARAWVQ